MNEYVNFWVLSERQYTDFVSFMSAMGITIPQGLFTPYNGMYYLEQTEQNLEAYEDFFFDFDAEDGQLGNSFGIDFFTDSTVPSVLRP